MTSKFIDSVYGAQFNQLNCKKLSELCVTGGVQTGPFGTQLHQKDYVKKGTPIITVEHLGENRVIHKNLPCVSIEDKERLKKFILKSGDIVFSRVGSVDRRALIKKSEDGWLFSGRCLRVRPNPSILDSQWLSYFFGLPAFKIYINGIAVGATMPSLNTRLLSDIPIFFPDLKTQKKAGKILAEIDDRIDLLHETNLTLEAIAQALFKSWFVDFEPIRAKQKGKQPEGIDKATAALFPDSFEQSELGLIPKGWLIGTLGDLANFQNGYAFKNKDWAESGHPVIKIANVKPGLISFEGCSYVDQQTVNGLDKFKLYRGDLLVGMTGYVGETGLVAEVNPAAYLNQRVGRFSTNAGLQDIGFIYCLTRNIKFKKFAESQSHGSAQANVSGIDLLKLSIVKPNSKILSKFNLIVYPLINSIISNYEMGQTLITLRDSLLLRLISGQLRVSDAEEIINNKTRVTA